MKAVYCFERNATAQSTLGEYERRKMETYNLLVKTDRALPAGLARKAYGHRQGIRKIIFLICLPYRLTLAMQPVRSWFRMCSNAVCNKVLPFENDQIGANGPAPLSGPPALDT